MRPIYPYFASKEGVLSGSWVEESRCPELILHIRNLCSSFPSIIMAYSASLGMKKSAEAIANSISEFGINIFMPEYPVPLATLSNAVSTRSMPVGLYLKESDSSNLCLIPLSSHGGLFDEQDLQSDSLPKSSKKGVIGSTEVIKGYVKELAGFADPFIEKGVAFSNFNVPFKEVEEALKESKQLSILFERDLSGLSASLSEDGCLLKVKENGGESATRDIARQIAKYLIKERFTTGAVLGPIGSLEPFKELGEIMEIEGGEFDLSYSVAFSNLLLGWWPDGLIALQGSSCFGDGLLSAIYFLESLRAY